MKRGFKHRGRFIVMKCVEMSHASAGGEYEIALSDKIEPLVPACYNTETTLKCDITRGQTAYDFELNSSTP